MPKRDEQAVQEGAQAGPARAGPAQAGGAEEMSRYRRCASILVDPAYNSKIQLLLLLLLPLLLLLLLELLVLLLLGT